jgi:hypothetical protein
MQAAYKEVFMLLRKTSEKAKAVLPSFASTFWGLSRVMFMQLVRIGRTQALVQAEARAQEAWAQQERAWAWAQEQQAQAHAQEQEQQPQPQQEPQEEQAHAQEQQQLQQEQQQAQPQQQQQQPQEEQQTQEEQAHAQEQQQQADDAGGVYQGGAGVLELALLGASRLNIIDVCHCLQGLSSVGTRCAHGLQMCCAGPRSMRGAC